jgi:hypothetical protein
LIHQFNIFFLFIFILFSQDSYSHGFGAHTLVKLANGCHATIYSICLYALDHKISVVSCDINKLRVVDQLVKTGKRSKCNCSIRLSFNNQFDEANDIICTPLQEFYLPAIGKWLPAYMLRHGDALLTENLTTKTLVYKELIEKPLKIYMLEVHNAHTFFVGKDSILTHNIFLPAAIGIGFAIPFGSVATGTIGGFFGPIGLGIGIAIGGITGIEFKSLYEKRIPKYKFFDCSISFIKDDTNRPSGCFIPEYSSDSSYIYVMPLDDNMASKPAGCIEIIPRIVGEQLINSCDKYQDIERIDNEGCFRPIEHNDLASFYSQEKLPVKEKPNFDNKPITASNWNEFEEKTPIGREHGKKFIPTGKRNPKDDSPIRKLVADISNTEMFKKDYLFAIDRLHKDHLEVWNSKGEWIGVANFDGSKNEKKSNAEKNIDKRRLRK